MPRPFRIWNLLGHESVAERFHIEETKGRHRLYIGGPGNLLVVDQMELELFDLLGSQHIWGSVEVIGELSYVTDVALNLKTAASLSLEQRSE